MSGEESFAEQCIIHTTYPFTPFGEVFPLELVLKRLGGRSTDAHVGHRPVNLAPCRPGLRPGTPVDGVEVHGRGRRVNLLTCVEEVNMRKLLSSYRIKTDEMESPQEA